MATQEPLRFAHLELPQPEEGPKHGIKMATTASNAWSVYDSAMSESEGRATRYVDPVRRVIIPFATKLHCVKGLLPWAGERRYLFEFRPFSSSFFCVQASRYFILDRMGWCASIDSASGKHEQEESAKR